MLHTFFHLLKRSESWDETIEQINSAIVQNKNLKEKGLSQFNKKYFFNYLYQQSDLLL
jgi:hypothetical protein